MKREEAILLLHDMKDTYDEIHENTNCEIGYEQMTALDMAIEALQTEPIRCGECKHQDECEEVVLFDANDEEVMGHRLHWCSYGERREK